MDAVGREEEEEKNELEGAEGEVCGFEKGWGRAGDEDALPKFDEEAGHGWRVFCFDCSEVYDFNLDVGLNLLSITKRIFSVGSFFYICFVSLRFRTKQRPLLLPSPQTRDALSRQSVLSQESNTCFNQTQNKKKEV